VLGDMLEMGAETSELHRQVGRMVAQKGVDRLLAMGEQASHLLAGAAEAGMSSEYLTQADTHRDLALQTYQLMAAGDWAIVKGSRGMRMEKVVECLMEMRGNDQQNSDSQPG
jgi:UDP-N-acetylmuramoyl-tripeptide--D-alanyl-D-alanine ligase